MAKGEKHKGAGKEVEKINKETVHLVFDEQGGPLIEASFELDESYRGETIYLEENYAFGPIENIYEAEGWKARKLWWQEILELPEEDVPAAMVSDKMKLHDLKKRLAENTSLELWIWLGQNPRDVSGYYWLISQLMEFQGRIQVLYLNNLPFINEKGNIFYPTRLGEILPKEYVKAARLARTVTLSEFELDPDEWNKLCVENGYIRVLEGGKKLISFPAAYYDNTLLDQLGTRAMKLPKLIAQVHSKAKIELPEAFLVWRVKVLIHTEQVIVQGDWDKGIKNIIVKATAGRLFVDIESDELDTEEGA